MTDFFNDNPEQIAVDPGYSGSRADAIANGELVDVTKVGQQVGFKWPLAMTKVAWENLVAWTDKDSERQVFQSERARLFTVLNECADTVRMRGPKSDRMRFRFGRVPRDGKSKRAHEVVVQLLAHPGDAGEPTLTIRIPVQT